MEGTFVTALVAGTFGDLYVQKECRHYEVYCVYALLHHPRRAEQVTFLGSEDLSSGLKISITISPKYLLSSHSKLKEPYQCLSRQVKPLSNNLTQ